MDSEMSYCEVQLGCTASQRCVQSNNMHFSHLPSQDLFPPLPRGGGGGGGGLYARACGQAGRNASAIRPDKGQKRRNKSVRKASRCDARYRCARSVGISQSQTDLSIIFPLIISNALSASAISYYITFERRSQLYFSDLCPPSRSAVNAVCSASRRICLCRGNACKK